MGIFASYLYINETSFFENLNNKIVDYFFLFRGELKPDKHIAIVDIDEKSLKKLGQWPWSRNIVASILQKLTKARVGIIGLDIVFAEADNSSLRRVLDTIVVEKNYRNIDFLPIAKGVIAFYKKAHTLVAFSIQFLMMMA